MYNYAFADINRIKNTFWLSFFYTRNENVLRRFCIIKLYNDHTKIQSTDKSMLWRQVYILLFIHKRKRHSRRRKCREIEQPLSKRVCSPVIVFFAVDASVFAEAGEFRLQVEFTLAALQTAHVPLLVHGEQVIAVRDLPSAARAQSPVPPVPADRRHVLHKHRRTARSLKTGTQSPVSLKHSISAPLSAV